MEWNGMEWNGMEWNVQVPPRAGLHLPRPQAREPCVVVVLSSSRRAPARPPHPSFAPRPPAARARVSSRTTPSPALALALARRRDRDDPPTTRRPTPRRSRRCAAIAAAAAPRSVSPPRSRAVGLTMFRISTRRVRRRPPPPPWPFRACARVLARVLSCARALARVLSCARAVLLDKFGYIKITDFKRCALRFFYFLVAKAPDLFFTPRPL